MLFFLLWQWFSSSHRNLADAMARQAGKPLK